MSSTGRSSNNGAGGTYRPSYREATRNAPPPAAIVGAHTQHFLPPAQVSTPIPRKASVASSYRSTASTAPSAHGSSTAPPLSGSGSAGWQPGVRRMSADAGYVSSRSADALLSDVKPLTVDLVALGLLNEVLDELLLSLVYRAGGLAPVKLKNALPVVLPNPLCRAAVEEAELELLSWFDSPEGGQWRSVGELPLGRGRDWKDANGREGAGRDAGRLMRVMTQTYSTLGDRAPNDETELAFVQAFRTKGGDIRQGILDSSALYLTAIIEFVAEHIIAALGRVMGHTGQRLSAAGVQELWDALSEDEALYEMLQKMKVRETIRGTLDRQQARNARRQAKALSQISSTTAASSSVSGGAATTLGRANSIASSPVPSQASASSSARHKHSHSAVPGLGDIGSTAGPPPPAPSAGTNGLGILTPRGSLGGQIPSDVTLGGARNGSLSSNHDSLDGNASTGTPTSARGSLGAISEQRAGSNNRSLSLSGPPAAHVRIPAAGGGSVGQRPSSESAVSSSLFGGRDGRKSTSSGRPTKSGLESMLGLDPAGGAAGDVKAQQFEQEGPDHFEALLKGGGTKKMSLTPVVMKRTESSGSEASSPRIPQTRQAAPPQSSDMSRTTSSASDKSSRSRSTGPTKRFAFASAAEASPDIVQPRQRTTSNGSIGHGLSVNGRPLTRDAGQAIKEDKEEDESDVDEFAPRKSKVAHKESLAELLSSPPPWQAPAVPSIKDAGRHVTPPSLTESAGPSLRSTPPMPSSTVFSASTAKPKPVARSPKVDADADEVNLDSDDEDRSAGNKRRASPAAELTAFLNDTPPPAKESTHSSSPRNNSPTPYLRSSPSVGSKLSVAEPPVVRATAPASAPAAASRPKERKGLKGLMSKVLGSGHSSRPAPVSRNFDRSLISQPTAAAPGVAETMRARTAALDTRTNVLDQPTRDLQDRSASVGFPSATLQPPVPETDGSLVRSRPTSALSINSHRSFDSESQRPRDEGLLRSRAVSQISQASTSGASIASGRPASGTIPWMAGAEVGAQDRLKAPVRSMSISRKPVSPELRNAVDLPPISPMSSPSSGAVPLPVIDSPQPQYPDSPILENGAADSAVDVAGQSPSRIQKSIASAAAHAAIAPSIPTFSSPAWTSKPEERNLPTSAKHTPAVEDEGPLSTRGPLESAAIPAILSVPYTPAAPTMSAADAPSVPLSQLIHLRSLLANATTADECRLLVNALLALWKVPVAAPSPFANDPAANTSAMEAQVGRIYAWMLTEAGLPAIGSASSPTATSFDAAAPVAPGTPLVIPPTPFEAASGVFAPDATRHATIDETASMHSSAEEEIEEAEYEARVAAGRAALTQASGAHHS